MGPLPGMGQMPPMGGANPQNLQAMAEAGDPRAIAMLQQMQAAQQGGGGPPQGGPPPGGGGMPPGGPPQGGMQPAPGGGVTMPQSQFTRPMQPNPDQEARQTQQKIQLLRMLAAQQGQGQ